MISSIESDGSDQLEILNLEKNVIHQDKFDENCVLLWKTSENIYVLDDEDINAFDYEDYVNKKCSNNRTLLHLACESGQFKLVNQCFNKITHEQFNQLELLVTFDNKTPADLAKEFGYEKKLQVFKLLNFFSDLEENFNENTVIHRLVIANQMKKLRNLLEYLSENRLIDTVGFGLRNSQGETPLDIAINEENSEAIYLLNHYELYEKTFNKAIYNEKNFETTDKILSVNQYANLPKKILREAQFKNLVFQGGGIKSLAYLGALKRLSEEENMFDMNKIERIAGTSAGAITAVLLGCGYSLDELEHEFITFDFKEILMDSNLKNKDKKIENLINEIKSLFESFGCISLNTFLFGNSKFLNNILEKLTHKTGFLSGEKFREWIEEKISNKLGVKYATFHDLQKKIADEGSKFKYIYLTGSNLSNGKNETFSHLHTPNMIISDALRISMSIPIVFSPHKFYVRNENGDRVIDSAKENSFYVDGGLLENYPIRMFDTVRIMKKSEVNFVNCETLGFRLVTSELKSQYESLSSDFKSNENNRTEKFSCFLSMLINFYLKSEELNHSEKKKDQERTVYIDSLGISPFEFGLSDKEKLKLINSGRDAAEDFLQAVKNRNILKIYSSSREYARAFISKGEKSKKSNRINEANTYFKKANELCFYLKGIVDLELSHNNLIVKRLSHSYGVTSVTVLNDQTIASGDSSGKIKLWNSSDGNIISTIEAHTSIVSSLAVMPDGRLVSGSDDKKIIIWNQTSDEPAQTLRGHISWVTSLAILKADRICSGSIDKTIIIWDVNSGQKLKTIKGHTDWVKSLAVLEDDRLASGSRNGEIKIWNLTSFKEIKTLKGHSNRVTCILALPANKLANGSKDDTILIWDTRNYTLILSLNGHREPVFSLCLLKYGVILASASSDKTIKLWDISNGKLVKTLEEHMDLVTSLALLDDGRLVSGSKDKSLVIWK